MGLYKSRNECDVFAQSQQYVHSSPYPLWCRLVGERDARRLAGSALDPAGGRGDRRVASAWDLVIEEHAIV